MPNGRFWSLVFQPVGGATACSVVNASGALYDVPRPQAVVIEIFRRDDNSEASWSILVSIADSLEAPTRLRCVFAVSNRAEECDERAEQGFPIVEGDIKLVAGVLSVETAFYPPREPGKPAALTMRRLMTVSNVRWNAPLNDLVPSAPAVPPAFDPPYWTLQCAPDLACPDSQLTGRILAVSPHRQSVEGVGRQGRIDLEDALYPDLQALIGKASVSSAAWIGRFAGWDVPKRRKRRFRFSRRSVFGPPSFRFEDIEIVGFRAPLKSSSDLVKRLNFHDTERGRNAPKHFQYKAACTTVVIEMLRYGRMSGEEVPPPFEDHDFMPQHELLVRLVVGRVDDDTSQAREAALFVPAIFVDNPWSKAVGRQLQGFPKVLAEFRSTDKGALGMDGRPVQNPNGDKVPLHEVTQVYIAGGLGAAAPKSRLLTIGYPKDDNGSADQFIAPDLTSIFSSTSRRGAPWNQLDFIEGEFRRTFARSVVGEQFGSFRVVQVSPVYDMRLPKAWIPGRYTLSNVRVAFPTGVATLRLEKPNPSLPDWEIVLNSLLDRPEQLAFATGDWYRVKCSMQLQFDDGLEW
jgi:hypothetical protein